MGRGAPAQIRYLRRRLLRALFVRLGLFSLLFFVTLFLFNELFVSDIGNWIADHTAEWQVYNPSTDADTRQIIESIVASNPDAVWEVETNPLDNTLWMRDRTIYQVLHDLWFPVAIALYAVGCLVIVVFALRKSLSYFDELEHAVERLVSNRTQPVALSHELAITENRLNAIRQSTLAAERASIAAEQRKNELVAYLAHDIKTPLTSIIGYLDLLAQTPGLDATGRSHVAISLRKAERLDELVDELFEITRLNLQGMTIEHTPIDVHLLCAQVAEEFFPQAQKKRLSIEVRCGNEPAGQALADSKISADGDKLARALGNIVRNAVAYANPGGRITLAYRMDAGTCTIEIANTGSSIAPEHLQTIFEKFYREDAARSTQQGGTGLGLAIAKEIIEAHGGGITARSGDGLTAFAITLPR